MLSGSCICLTFVPGDLQLPSDVIVWGIWYSRVFFSSILPPLHRRPWSSSASHNSHFLVPTTRTKLFILQGYGRCQTIHNSHYEINNWGRKWCLHMLHCMADTLLASDLEEKSTGLRASCTLKFPSLFTFRILRLRICQSTSPFFFYFGQSESYSCSPGWSESYSCSPGWSQTYNAAEEVLDLLTLLLLPPGS